MIEIVRTRFAPSPTGYLHVGSLRTALFSYLFAKHNNGQFILRIEDTDQSRYIKGSVENMLASLKWAGIQHDEGPGVGGDFGPYFQSQRTEIYQKYASKLLESGHAYYCFCTSEELEDMRERQTVAGLSPQYDGTWRDKSRLEVEENLAKGLDHVIRLKIPRDGETVFHDLIRGTITVQNRQVDDQVLIKSDGYPTYHLANVVDDHLMEITHIIRGEEWLLSTPKHIHMYKAFGWEIPALAHLPLLLNKDRSKLSKRQGDVAVEDYIEKGYLPEALINFVTLLGWSPGNDQEFFTLSELIEAFSIERVNKSGAVFDVDKLNWMNGQYLRKLDEDTLIPFLTPFLESAGADVSDAAKTRKIILAIYKNLDKASDIYQAAEIFFKDILEITEKEALEFLKESSAKKVLSTFLQKAQVLTLLDMDVFKKTMKTVQTETGIKGAQLWKPIRIALTGSVSGPELPAVIEVFGKEKVCSFINQALEKYTG